jgi:hypothetical protein
MRLRINLIRSSMVVMTALLFTMCSTDEGIRPSDDTAYQWSWTYLGRT